jgi:hypothetical protein
MMAESFTEFVNTKFHFVTVAPRTGNCKDACWFSDRVDHTVRSSGAEGQPSTTAYQELSLFDYDNPEDAKHEITDAVHYCLHLLQKGQYIMDDMSNSISSNPPQMEEGV